MKVFMFHLMPYAYLDMGYTDKYRAAWVVLPNTYFDPKKGHELYNRYLDELGMLDHVSGVADDAGDEHLAVRQLDVLPHLPLVLMVL